MNVGVDPDSAASEDAGPAASETGASSLGFAGTVRKETVSAAAGLTTLADDEFGGGPRAPMLPSTWDQGGTSSV